MTMFLPILVLIAIMSRFGGGPLTLFSSLGAGPTIWLSLAAIFLPRIPAWLLVRHWITRLDATGSPVAVSRISRTLALEQLAVGLITAAAIAWIGLLDAVRATLGDLPVADECLVCLPWMLATCLISAQSHSLEVRLRSASLVGSLDGGAELPPHHSIGCWVWLRLRETVLCTLAPGFAFLAWIESAERGILWLDGLHPGILLTRHASGETVTTLLADAVVIAGMIAIAASSPLLVAAILPTVRVRSGRLFDELAAICRATNTRCPPVRLWKPSMGQANAMVMGVLPGTRSLLVSDRLVAGMSDDQLRAVLSHELGHIRRRHIPWIAAAVIGASMASHAAAAGLGLADGPGMWSLAAILLTLGMVSRRFEREADLCAAEALERMGLPRESALRATFEALLRVAELNRMRITKRDFLHGTIEERLHHLVSIARNPEVGTRTHRIATHTKLVIAAILIAAAAGWSVIG